MGIDQWLSVITTVGVIMLGADKILFQFRKRQWDQDQQLSTHSSIPLPVRMLAIETTFRDGNIELSKKMSALTTHLLEIDLAIKVLQANELNHVKDLGRLETDVRVLQERRR